MNFCVVRSRLGYIILAARHSRLISLDVTEEPVDTVKERIKAMHPEWTESAAPFGKLLHLLDRYAGGERVDFAVPLDWDGMSDFTRKVLRETRNIPYGKVLTYGLLSKRVGYGNAARAVGQALKRNPFPLVVPCHRVIQGDCTLGGFGMGLSMKRKLLSLEGIPLERMRDFLAF